MAWFTPRKLLFKGCSRDETLSHSNPITIKEPQAMDIKCTTIFEDQEDLPKDEYIALPIVSADILTNAGALKPSYEVVLDKRRLKEEFLPGDSLEVKVYNDPDIASILINRLELSSNQIIHIESTNPPKGSLAELFNGKSISIKRLFEEHVDLNYFPKKMHLLRMSHACTDPFDAKDLFYLTTPEGSNLYIQMIRERTTLMDLLHTWKSCRMSLEMILWFISPLPSRPYSIASNIFDNDRISFIFNRIEYLTPDGLLRKGIGSSFLTRQLSPLLSLSSLSSSSSPCSTIGNESENENEKDNKEIRINSNRINHQFTDNHPFLHVIKRKNNKSFSPSLPFPFNIKENGFPIILVCVGVGIGPFMSFLRSISHQIDTDTTMTINRNIWLIFGFRSREQDFLFRKVLKENFVKHGILSKLHVAVSRDDGKYVQDIMLEYQSELFDMMKIDGTTLYLCGDELTMIKDVNDTLVKIIELNSKRDDDGDDDESCSLTTDQCNSNAHHIHEDQNQNRSQQGQQTGREMLQEWIRRGKILKDVWI